MLHDFDLKPLSIKKVDMASSPPLYKAPEPPSFPEVHEGKVVRAGSCHCGGITYTLQTDPDPLQVKRCDCSICHRVRLLPRALSELIYPALVLQEFFSRVPYHVMNSLTI